MARSCNEQTCEHSKWANTTHCAEMECPNYINKCQALRHVGPPAIGA